MSNIIFISFDIRKDEYPSMSYSMAALVAALRQENHVVSHYSVDLQHSIEEMMTKQSILDIVTKKLESNNDYFRKFKFIAISLTSWTVEYCQVLLGILSDYQGKVIVGGYEVTSRSEENLFSNFARVDYFIKGYAEKALKEILSGSYQSDCKIVSIPIDSNDLVSPYLTNVLSTTSKKLHWETKRGCKFRCGFCEWGNATINVIDVDYERLLGEINLFKESFIDEINILDGTFNIGKYYLDIFKKLLEIEDLKITCQARFETLDTRNGKIFLELCKNARNRVHLEFGLQTIHENEMTTIGRKNDLDKIKRALSLLKLNQIDYEVSIIYAIPGQTIESLIDTIEFLITQGCRNIKAYPLSIPKNSNMESKKVELNVVEGKNKYNVSSVISTYSFPEEQRADMDRIVERLNNGQLFTEIEALPPDYNPGRSYKYNELTNYQWEITSVETAGLDANFLNRIEKDYVIATTSDIAKMDAIQGLMQIGRKASNWTTENILQYINGLLSGENSLELQKWEYPDVDPKSLDQLGISLKKNNSSLIPKKYFCKVRISKSGNIYVYRDIIPSIKTQE